MPEEMITQKAILNIVMMVDEQIKRSFGISHGSIVQFTILVLNFNQNVDSDFFFVGMKLVYTICQRQSTIFCNKQTIRNCIMLGIHKE